MRGAIIEQHFKHQISNVESNDNDNSGLEQENKSGNGAADMWPESQIVNKVMLPSVDVKTETKSEILKETDAFEMEGLSLRQTA